MTSNLKANQGEPADASGVGESERPGSFASHRLPRGRHGLPPTLVADSQRWRLIGAGAEVFAEHGYNATTSRLIAGAAAVSSSTFYQHFDGVSACLRAGFGVAAESLFVVLSSVCRALPAGPERVEAGLEDLLAFCRSESQLTMLLGTELAASLPEIAPERDLLIERLAVLLRHGSARHEEAALFAAPEERLIAGALALTSNRPSADNHDDAPDFAAQLAELLLIGSADGEPA